MWRLSKYVGESMDANVVYLCMWKLHFICVKSILLRVFVVLICDSHRLQVFAFTLPSCVMSLCQPD